MISRLSKPAYAPLSKSILHFSRFLPTFPRVGFGGGKMGGIDALSKRGGDGYEHAKTMWRFPAHEREKFSRFDRQMSQLAK